MAPNDPEELPSPRTPHLGPGASPASWTPTPIPSLAPINSRPNYVQDGDNASLTSFKTCPSDPNLSSLVPRQVSDNYSGGKPPPVPLPIVVSTRPSDRLTGPSASAALAQNPRQPVKTSENVVGGVKHLVRDR